MADDGWQAHDGGGRPKGLKATATVKFQIRVVDRAFAESRAAVRADTLTWPWNEKGDWPGDILFFKEEK